ncbi:uncharacterized protein N7498_006460 [Penicillium cinerascens]|uniref:DUF7907 domain-containing protein n=1 Tax=Penicillium cinerascens TaxID=70096 RepID=A0A9W9SXE5_9EURO|nr:uncharacterized protein N7498_006460 [Penicillium cinerascens]KAJ5201797.1 hypothetical protein N7498_006460 [Penicillium cinerascens]
MNLLSTLLFAAAASASPLEKLFNLVTSGSGSNNGLYVTTESNGPLNSIAVLSDKADAATFYVNHGTVRYQAPNGAPYAMALVSGSDAQEPVEVSVSPSSGSSGFKVADNGVLSVEGQNWGGWLVCDGDSEPALEYVNTQSTADLKEGCEKVQLHAVVETSS